MNAEKRWKEQQAMLGNRVDEEDNPDLSPAEQRALKAQKRAAWREARLKSLENVS